MSLDARDLLHKLFTDGQRLSAGVRSTRARLTARHLAPYWESGSLDARERFAGVLQSAADAGAVVLTREHGLPTGDIRAVDLESLDRLGSFLGVPTRSRQLEQAQSILAPWLGAFPVLTEVVEQWRVLRKVRTTAPEDAEDWADAARVVQAMGRDQAARQSDLPVREVSARIFGDSKRIEALTALIDVLLMDDVSAPAREPREVWAEVGLRREEQPVRLAGRVVVERERVTALLDAPYGAFPPATVLGISGAVEKIITIENLTTFHTEAVARRDQPVLLIYAAGMPSPAWCSMYERLLRSVTNVTPLLHWGDIDEGGFRIAARIASIATACGRTLLPYRMRQSDIPAGFGKTASPPTVARMREFSLRAGWEELAAELVEGARSLEQETLDNRLDT